MAPIRLCQEIENEVWLGLAGLASLIFGVLVTDMLESVRSEAGTGCPALDPFWTHQVRLNVASLADFSLKKAS